MRVEYGSVEKDGSSDLDADWLDVGWVAICCDSWLAEAEQAGVAEPNAMVVGTVDADGRPVTRTVLCKSVDESGITFYTNYDSDKGEQLAASPYASATFPWFLLGRQVHVRGPVTKVSAEETADYWSKRPRGSQLGAWASHAEPADRLARGAAASSWPTSPSDSPTSTTSRCRRTGVATSSPPRSSSSGRAGRTGCTTGFGSAARSSSACSRSRSHLGVLTLPRASRVCPRPGPRRRQTVTIPGRFTCLGNCLKVPDSHSIHSLSG